MKLTLIRRASSDFWRRAAGVALILVPASTGLAPAQAAASPGWRIERYLPGETVQNGLIFAAGKSNAWAVASDNFGALDIVRWNGRTWQSVPSPANLAGNAVTAQALAGSGANNMWLFSGVIADTWTGSEWNQQVLTGLDSGFGVSAAAVSGDGLWASGAAPGNENRAAASTTADQRQVDDSGDAGPCTPSERVLGE